MTFEITTEPARPTSRRDFSFLGNDPDLIFKETERLTGIPARDFVMKFEPLGRNCEFGFIQRLCGAEPLSLLRFAGMPIDHVTKGIEAGFEGMESETTMEAILTGTSWDMIQRTPSSHMVYHTFLTTNDCTEEELKRGQSRRLKFLRDKLLEDIAESEKTFIFWNNDANITDLEARRLLTALQTRGRVTLIYIVVGQPSGVVEEICPGLMRATIERLGVGGDMRPDSERHSLGAWMTILINAHMLINRSQQHDRQ